MLKPSSRGRCAGLSLLLVACGGEAASGAGAAARGGASEASRVPAGARALRLLASEAAAVYVRVRQDERRCPAPRCGGYFVQRVNYATTLCADGRAASECYVAMLDLAALAASDAERATLRAQPEPWLLRGYLGPVLPGSLDFGLLRVTEGWRGHEALTPTGTFLRVREQGPTCGDAGELAPCSRFSAAALNRNEPLFDTNELALPATTTPEGDALRQLSSEEGLLVAADLATADADVVRIDANEYYLPLGSLPAIDAGIELDAATEITAATELGGSEVGAPAGECAAGDAGACFTVDGSI